jgi:hypothetical protein
VVPRNVFEAIERWLRPVEPARLQPVEWLTNVDQPAQVNEGSRIPVAARNSEQRNAVATRVDRHQSSRQIAGPSFQIVHPLSGGRATSTACGSRR